MPGLYPFNQMIAIAIMVIASFSVADAEYRFKTDYFEQNLDHFSFAVNKTFKMKYLYNDTFWNASDNGPIFFYTGNEGAIEWFAQNTGFMWDIAAEFNALLLFAEHRYYGESLPFGNNSFSTVQKVGYLTSEQALADFAVFLEWFQHHHGARNSPIIAFGGSYGGMLTAWMRMKYPHVIAGGIAASAPIWQFAGLTPCTTFSQIVSRDFSTESDDCADTIRKSWKYITMLGETSTGREWLSHNWKLCKPLESKHDVDILKYWLVEVYGNLAMTDYPMAASFLQPLPAFPIKKVCQKLFDSSLPDKTLLRALFKGISIYFNYTGSAQCLDTGSQASSALGDLGWDYQACTEMAMPMCSDGVNDIFEPSPWNFTAYAEDCQSRWKVSPKPYNAEIMYGGKQILSASNIVFSNGLLDPWSGGGVLKDLSETLIAIVIPEGAHHLDLRAATEFDPPSLINAREIEKHQIRKWIAQFHANRQREDQAVTVQEVYKELDEIKKHKGDTVYDSNDIPSFLFPSS